MGFKSCANKMSNEPTTTVSGFDFHRQKFQSSVTNVKNELSTNEISTLISLNKLPSDCRTIIPSDPVRSDWVSSKLIWFHLLPFQYGLSFPFPQLILDFFTTFKLSPAQIMPGLWRLLLSIETIGKECWVTLGIHEVFTQYDLRVVEAGRYGHTIRHTCEHLIYGSSEVSDRSWKAKYFFVEKDSLGDLGVVLEGDWSEPDIPTKDLGKRAETDQLIKNFLAIPAESRRFVTEKKDKAPQKRSRPAIVIHETSASTMEKSPPTFTRGSLKGIKIKNIIKQEKTEPSVSFEIKPQSEALPTAQVSKKQKVADTDEDVVILGTKMRDVNTSLKTYKTNIALNYYDGKSGPEVLCSTGAYALQALHSLAVAQERMDNLESEVINLRGDKIEADIVRLNYKTVLEANSKLEKDFRLQMAEIDNMKTEIAELQGILDKYEKEAKETAEYYGRIGRLEVLLDLKKDQFDEEKKVFDEKFPGDTYVQDATEDNKATNSVQGEKPNAEAVTSIAGDTVGHTPAQDSDANPV